MASIPLAALSVKPPEQPDLLGEYGKVMQLKSLAAQQAMITGQQQIQQQTIKSNQLNLQQKQKEIDDQNKIEQIVTESGDDLKTAIPKIMAVNPQLGIAFQKSLMESDKATLEQKKALIGYHAEQTGRLAQILGTVKDEQSKNSAVADLLKEGTIDAQTAVQYINEPFDPAKVAQLQQQALSAKDQLELKQKELAEQHRVEHEKEMEKPNTEAELAVLAAKGDKDAEAALKRLDQSKREARPVNQFSSSGQDVEDTAQSILEGHAPPVLTQYSYRDRTAIAGHLQRAGYNLAQAEQDYKAVGKYLGTLNGAQQVRLRQAVQFADDTLPQLEAAYNRLKSLAPGSGFKILNKAAMAAMKQLPGEAGSAAQQLDSLIADYTSELGTVYKGGNSSTDESLALASKNISGDWNDETFKDALKRIRQSIAIRKNSMQAVEPAGISSGSPYIPSGGAQGGGKTQSGAPPKDFGAANGKPEGATGTLPDGTKIVVKGGRIVSQ